MKKGNEPLRNLETYQYLKKIKQPEVFYHSVTFYHKMSDLKPYKLWVRDPSEAWLGLLLADLRTHSQGGAREGCSQLKLQLGKSP